MKFAVMLNTKAKTKWCSLKAKLARYHDTKTYNSGRESLLPGDYEVSEEVVDAEMIPGGTRKAESIVAERMWIEEVLPFRKDWGSVDLDNVTSATIHDAPGSMFG